MREHDRVDEKSPADADRSASCAKTVALRAHFQGEDLRRDEERNRAPGRGVNEVEQEEHGNCSRCDGGHFGPVVSGCFVQGAIRFTAKSPKAPPMKHLRRPSRSTI